MDLATFFQLAQVLDLMLSASSALGDVTKAVTDVSSSASQIKTSILTILGVLVTVGLAWAIVKGLQK